MGELMNKTRIEYLDLTWNVTCGCSGVGCAVRRVCWAMAQSKRDKHRCMLCYNFVPHLHEERLFEPIHVKKPAKIGVSFKGDFYDTNLSYMLRKNVLNVVNIAKQHTFFFLTKQPQNILPSVGLLTNAWFGVTVNMKEDLWRIGKLREVRAKRWVSFEPLYGDLGEIEFEGIGWVIIGAQTRPELQPKTEWINNILKQVCEYNIPVFLKNNLHLNSPIQENSTIQEFPKL